MSARARQRPDSRCEFDASQFAPLSEGQRQEELRRCFVVDFRCYTFHTSGASFRLDCQQRNLRVYSEVYHLSIREVTRFKLVNFLRKSPRSAANGFGIIHFLTYLDHRWCRRDYATIFVVAILVGIECIELRSDRMTFDFFSQRNILGLNSAFSDVSEKAAMPTSSLHSPASNARIHVRFRPTWLSILETLDLAPSSVTSEWRLRHCRTRCATSLRTHLLKFDFTILSGEHMDYEQLTMTSGWWRRRCSVRDRTHGHPFDLDDLDFSSSSTYLGVYEDLGGIRRFSLCWILSALLQMYLRHLWCHWIDVTWVLPLTFARFRLSWSSSGWTNFRSDPVLEWRHRLQICMSAS